MKFVVLVCLATMAAAAPQLARPYAIISDNRQDLGGGHFDYEFETENGIYVGSSGRPGSKGQSNMEGYYRYPLPEGGFGEVRYVADENGFRVESPQIPHSTAYTLGHHRYGRYPVIPYSGRYPVIPYSSGFPSSQIRLAERLRRLGLRQG
ncbi:cuticle protein AM1199-like [Panulirus ornatus]|uniref:cuticle protein AM1199-like n=1 Tax=Panulirus ornatus TaxID=150431 RepID=UPI003A8B703F